MGIVERDDESLFPAEKAPLEKITFEEGGPRVKDCLAERRLFFPGILLSEERRVILARRYLAGDCGTSKQPQDKGLSELARVSRMKRSHAQHEIEIVLARG